MFTRIVFSNFLQILPKIEKDAKESLNLPKTTLLRIMLNKNVLRMILNKNVLRIVLNKNVLRMMLNKNVLRIMLNKNVLRIMLNSPNVTYEFDR